MMNFEVFCDVLTEPLAHPEIIVIPYDNYYDRGRAEFCGSTRNWWLIGTGGLLRRGGAQKIKKCLLGYYRACSANAIWVSEVLRVTFWPGQEDLRDVAGFETWEKFRLRVGRVGLIGEVTTPGNGRDRKRSDRQEGICEGNLEKCWEEIRGLVEGCVSARSRVSSLNVFEERTLLVLCKTDRKKRGHSRKYKRILYFVSSTRFIRFLLLLLPYHRALSHSALQLSSIPPSPSFPILLLSHLYLGLQNSKFPMCLFPNCIWRCPFHW